MRTLRYKLEATVDQEENMEIQKFCKKHNISRYALIRRAVFGMIKQYKNRNLKEFS